VVRTLLGVCFVSASVFAQDAVPPPTVVSSNQAHAVRHQRLGNTCQIVALRETEVKWVLDKCLGEQDDLFFISNDGNRFWVLHVLPSKAKSSSTRKTPAWWRAVVAVEYDWKGRVLRQRRLSELLQPIERTKVHELDRHFKWLEGVVGMKGRSPRVNEKNQVEFEVVGGKTVTLDF
jgi:hypothetical protein